MVRLWVRKSRTTFARQEKGEGEDNSGDEQEEEDKKAKWDTACLRQWEGKKTIGEAKHVAYEVQE